MKTAIEPRLVTDLAPATWAWRFKADELDTDRRTFEGLSNTWNLDLGGDVVEQGAFKRTLGRWRNSDRIIPLLDSHDGWSSVESVVGKLVDAKETKAGLWTKFELVDDDKGAAVLTRIEGGFVDGLSIGYRPIKIRTPTEEESRAGVWRFLEEVELREVSVVTFPMNVESRIDASSVKTVAAMIERAKELLAAPEPTEDEKAELTQLHDDIGALLAPTASVPKETGLAPDDPKRIAQAETLRTLQYQQLAPR